MAPVRVPPVISAALILLPHYCNGFPRAYISRLVKTRFRRCLSKVSKVAYAQAQRLAFAAHH